MPAYSIGPIIATITLNVTNYVKNAPRILQPTTTIFGVKALFFLLPQIFTMIALLFIHLYPIEKLEDSSFQEQLKLLHLRKKKN